MDEILTSLASPFWWFSVFIVGIAVNLTADWIRSSWSARRERRDADRRARNSEASRSFDEIVATLSANEADLQIAVSAEAGLRIQTLTQMLVSGTFAGLLGWGVSITMRAIAVELEGIWQLWIFLAVTAAATLLTTLMAQSSFESAQRLRRAIRAARKGRFDPYAV